MMEKDRLVQFRWTVLSIAAVLLWLGGIGVQLLDDRQWRRDATSLLRDMGTVIQDHERRLSIAVVPPDAPLSKAHDAPDIRWRVDTNAIRRPALSGPDLIREALEIAGFVPDAQGVYRVSDDSVRRLCASGRVCEVMGHCWQDIAPQGASSLWRPRCGLCGAVKNERDYLE